MAQSWLTATSSSQVQAIFLPQPPGTTDVLPHTQLIFVFLVEMRFPHVGPPLLEFLTSCDPLALASQTAGITGLEPQRLAKIDHF